MQIILISFQLHLELWFFKSQCSLLTDVWLIGFKYLALPWLYWLLNCRSGYVGDEWHIISYQGSFSTRITLASLYSVLLYFYFIRVYRFNLLMIIRVMIRDWSLSVEVFLMSLECTARVDVFGIIPTMCVYVHIFILLLFNRRINRNKVYWHCLFP